MDSLDESPDLGDLVMDLCDFSVTLPDLQNLSQEIDPDFLENIPSQEILDQCLSPITISLPQSPQRTTVNLALLSPPSPIPYQPNDIPQAPIIVPPPPQFCDSTSPQNMQPRNMDPRKRYLSDFPTSHQEPPCKRKKPMPNPPLQNLQPDLNQPHSSRDPRFLPSNLTRPAPMSGSGTADMLPFTLIEDDRRHYKKYDVDARLVTLRFRKIADEEDIGRYLREMFSHLLQYLPQQNVSPQDRIGLSISNSSRPDQRSIGISLRRADQLNADVILQTIEKVMQSNEDFFMDGCLTVRYIHIQLPSGEGRNAVDLISNFHDFCRQKRAFLVIQNRDKLCLARALVVARAYIHKDESPQKQKFYNSIRHSILSRAKLQQREAEKLCREAGVDLSQGGGIDEIRQFQQYLKEYKITVFTDRVGKKVMFEGANVNSENYFDLIFGENHFNVILNIEAAFNAKNYCRSCKVRFDHLHHHRCERKCVMCNHMPLCEDVAGVRKTCGGCNRVFRNEDCFAKHKVAIYEKNKSTCDAVKRCGQCNVLYNTLKRRDPHKCGEAYCNICQMHKPSWHLCFMKKHVTKTDMTKEKFMYVFFDFECSQDMPAEKPGYTVHNPNLCVAEQMCHECIGQEDMSIPCGTCGVRQHIFEGNQTLTEFMKYVVQPRTQFKKVVMVAHNMKSYDGQFILNHMIKQLKWTPDVIMTGTKIQVIKYANIRILDSLSFLNSKLSDLPSMFDLQCNSKGYFPHFFNRHENWNYVGELPPPEDYGCDTMKEKERRLFLNWYEEEKLTNNIFNFREELIKYCKQDVTILRLACLKFRSIFLQQNQIDPFLESITIASACMLTFRKQFLKPNTIGILPVGGYRLADRQSAIALQWLKWVEKTSNITLKHTGNSREMKVCGYKVDGYHENQDKSVKTVYEFNGCWYHGCPDCFKKRDQPIQNSRHETMALRYENTLRKQEMLERNGYQVVTMWECSFNNMKANNIELRRFVDSLPNDVPLNPREAFFGGRTNATKLYYKAKEGGKIRYLDVCSLYPWACKYGKFPVGHPKILVGDACPKTLEGIYGMAKVKILPPADLYHPVLPMKMHNRLFFPLCMKCTEELRDDFCNHSEEERCLTGTWVVDELRLAEEMGYKIKKVFEVWKYQTTQYNGKDGGLFVEYINAFLKLKQEASGWPEWVQTEEDKNTYIRDFECREGIKLDKSNIKRNKGFRALAKLMLNSFWGKFGQRENLQQTVFLDSKEELTSLVTDPGIVVEDVLPINEDIMMASYKYDEEAVTPSSRASVVIAAFVTAIARMKLYSYLRELKERVLYFDTDSIIFIERSGDVSPPTGDFLGDLTDEITDEYGPNAFIDIFVSGGPKNYAYRVNVNGVYKTVCKVKGINLHYKNSNVVNFDALIRVVTEEPEIVVTLPVGKRIYRGREHEVFTGPEKKTYKVVYKKRRRVDDYDTLPYGYKRPHIE